MDVGTERHRLHVALLAQGYARVAVEKLSLTGDVDLTAANVPAQLDDALRSATNNADWQAIGQRFALLKETPGGYFDNLYLRANGHVLHLVVVNRFGTVPLKSEWYGQAFDAVWPIVQNIDDLLPKFQLPGPVQEAGKQLVNAYLSSSDPATQAAASLLNAALVAHVVNAGPLSAYIAICEAGISSDLLQQIDSWKFHKNKSDFALYPPYMFGFAWDVTLNQVHGHDETGGGTLSPTQLRQSLGAS